MSESINTNFGSHRKAWITAAVSTAVLLLLLRQRRQKRKAARQTAADATRAALRRTAQRSTLPAFVQADGLPTGWGLAPPVFYPPHCAVVPLVLPSEMAEIERSSHLVRKVSLATNHNGADGEGVTPSAFILCSYTGVVAQAAEGEAPREPHQQEQGALQSLLTKLLAHHPILKDQFAAVASQWVSLATVLPVAEQAKAHAAAGAMESAADAVVPVFTHFLQGPDDCVLLGGVNGPYFIAAVLTGFEGSLSGVAAAPSSPGSTESSHVSPKSHAEASKTSAASATSADAVMDLAGVVRGVAQATFKVPLASAAAPATATAAATVTTTLAAARLPGGAAFAVHRGYYRVLCVRDGRELELCVPAEVAVRSELVNLSLLTPTGSPVVPRVASKAEAAGSAPEGTPEALLSLAARPTPFATEDAVEVRVTEEVFAALLAKPEEAAATLWAASGADASTSATAAVAFHGVTARALAASSHGRANMVTMVYVQPQLGVLFSVHPLSSVVYEPWMTDLPTVLYYPLGDADDGSGSDDNAAAAAPPLMSIEYVLELPETWEVLKKDEEELRHNVLFHFTNWESATVSSSMTEISGIRCVMFHEVRDGRRCRSYILPRGSTVLIVRWETSLETWEKYLPVFQQTLDTLHIDATPITK